MGIPGFAYYGYVDLGSAIEDTKSLIQKIETNKYSKQDLIKLAQASNAILTFMLDADKD